MARKQLVDLDMEGNKVTDMANPSSAQDAATKNYVDTADAALQVQIDDELVLYWMS